MIDPLDTAVGMSAATASGEATPTELVDRALGRLERWQPVTNAFSQVYADEAREEARRAGRAIASGEKLGTLHGVPVVVKDLFDLAGRETTGCCRAYAGNVAAADAEMVTRVRAAGAIVVGKTNQHELAAGATNQISACGPTANPWDPTRITGGSSGGSGAAVAAGVVPIALGSDTGGSIRMPSSLCGCWGLKPTTGKLSTAGMMPMAPSLDCPGPMARTAGDLALAWRLMSGEGPPAAHGLRRLGILGGWFERAHPQTRAAVNAAAREIQGLGLYAEVVDADGFEDVVSVWRTIAWWELADAHAELLRPGRRELVSPAMLKQLDEGAGRTDEERRAAWERARWFRDWFSKRLRDLDLLVGPTTPFPAPLPDESHVDVGGGTRISVRRGGIAWFTEPVNLAGVPAVAVPAGRSSQGLPLSVQLIGREGDEGSLLSLCLELERSDERFRTELPGE